LKAQGNIILIASHILAALQPLCDELLLLKNGQLNQSINPQDFEKIEQQMMDGFLAEKLERLEGMV